MSSTSLRSAKPISSRPPLAELVNYAHSIKKEKQNIRIYDTFDINPAKYSLYPDKPGHVKPQVLKKDAMSLNSLESTQDSIDDLDQHIKSKISRNFATPKEKFAFPQTSNQDIGWFSDDIIKTKTYSKNSCPETRYANVYYANLKKSPYAASK